MNSLIINCNEQAKTPIHKAKNNQYSKSFIKYSINLNIKILILIFFLQTQLTHGQGKIIINGSATINLKDAAYISTKDVSVSPTGSFKVNNSTLKIAGDINSDANIYLLTGTLEMEGTSSQMISGSMFTNKAIKNLIVNNTGTGLSVSSTIDDTLKISGTLSFGNSTSILNTGDNITLVSNISGTANVGILASGNAINGNVIVERYVHIGTGAGQHGKSWQLLGTPTTGQTIKESWMENGSTPAGYGIWISNPLGTSAGFDGYSQSPSLKYYVASKNLWVGINKTNIPIYNQKAYMVFVRGDRSVTGTNQSATNTVLRTKGNLLTGSLPEIEFLPNSYEAVGNPYASVIDFTLIHKNSYVDEVFYVWDPNLIGTYGLGGYQTISSTNEWKPIPGGTSTYPAGIANSQIQSGQGFFVHSTATDPPSPDFPTIFFTEDCKSTESASVNFARTGMQSRSFNKSYFRASMFTGPEQNDLIVDGNVVAFSQEFSNKIDGQDAIKMTNSGENFGLKRNGKILSIEARSTVSENDTLYYNISQLKARKYQLRFAPENMQSMNLQAFLVDKFMKTTTSVSLTDSSFIDISVTSDPQSASASRFQVIFKPSTVLPVTFVSISAEAKNMDIIVQWNVENEMSILRYELERSTDGIHFSKTANIPVHNNESKTYLWSDKDVMQGIYYYRIRSIDIDGQIKYSQIAKVRMGGIEQSLSVFPNPIVNGTIHLQFRNQPAGNYKVRLLNSAGQIIISKIISHNSADINEIITSAQKLAKGIYQLEVTMPGGYVEVLKVMN